VQGRYSETLSRSTRTEACAANRTHFYDSGTWVNIPKELTYFKSQACSVDFNNI